MAVVEARGLKKVFEPDIVALEDFNLDIEKGDFIALIGPSGCGKTTFMRMLAGFETVTAGTLLFDGKGVEGTDFNRSVVFQDIRLLPWLTVSQNLTLGLKLRGVSDQKGKDAARELMASYELEEFAERFPHEVSVGTQQKLGMARVLLNDPELIMCDEPFNSLDWRTRDLLQNELLRLYIKTRKTIIYVTHNVREAVYVARKIVVVTVRPGRVKEIIPVDLPDERWEKAVKLSSRYLEQVHAVAASLKDEVIRGRELERKLGY